MMSFDITLAEFVGNLTIACTMGLFLTGTHICYKIYKKGTVGDIASLPFISLIAE